MSLRRTLLTFLTTFLIGLLTLAVVGLAGPAGAERGGERAAPVAEKGIPRTYDAALAHFELAKSTKAVRRFVTPNDNIYCSIARRGPKGCEITKGAVRDPAVCPRRPLSQRVGRIEFRRGRAVPVCNTDTIRRPRVKVLPYGTATKVGRFACLSERQGVTCINVTRTEGFFLHRGEYVIFNAG